ncbi:MAG: GNAT family N-acetyltransferase [Anaerolineae bacterium]
MLIEAFDPKIAGESEWQAMNRFANRRRKEEWPNDLPVPVEKTRIDMTVFKENTRRYIWVVWQSEEIVGMAALYVEDAQTNTHLAWLDMWVLPHARGHGLGRQLLALAAEAAQSEGRRLLMGETDSYVPAGDAFAAHLGASKGLVAYTNELDIADVDRAMIRRWIERAPERASGFSLEFWGNSVPDEDIDRWIRMFEASMNDEPRGDLELEDEKLTPDEVREWDRVLSRRGVEAWTAVVREDATGELAGFTSVRWNPYEPDSMWQGGTGTSRNYRNRGLGRWMKAAMMERILRERPSVKRVRTGNAEVNAPMLKINWEMGYRPTKTWTMWQIEVERALAWTGQGVVEDDTRDDALESAAA